MPAIPVHHTKVVDKPWDGPGAEAKIPNDAGSSVLEKAYAFRVAGADPDTKKAYKLIHHEVVNGAPAEANVNGVRNALSRMEQLVPPLSDTDAAGVKAHLQAHLDDFKKADAAAEEPQASSEGMRALFGGTMELRDTTEDGTLGTLVGFLAVFNEWTEIDSALEGHFLERVAPGAFRKTFQEGVGRIRCIFHHGNDPSVGVRVLGPVNVLEERGDGAWCEVPLLDTSYNRDLVPGIKAGLYGMSFRFKMIRQNFNRYAKRSSWNPKGLAERTLTEVMVPEFGPTPFGAYVGAQAGMRSITDDVTALRLAQRHPDVLSVFIPRGLTTTTATAAGAVFASSEHLEGAENVQCTNCQAMNASDAVYCDQCGEKLTNPGGEAYSAGPDETVQCPECGCMNDTDANYCDQCGAELVDADTDAKSNHGKAPVTTGAHAAATGPLATRAVTERLFQRSLTFTALHPWAMEESSLAVVLAILEERRAGQWPSREEVMARLGIRAENPEAETPSPVAVIRAFGPIVPRGGMVTDVSGITSIEALSDKFRAALADPDVEHILFDFDSPGGSSAMVPEFGAEIFAARGQKPMTAVANTLMASAAYWLASMCDEIVASPSADVGSVGVYATHYDNTGAREQDGQKVTIVKSAGSPFKAEFSSDVELSDEAEAEMQRRVDAVYEDFVDAVALGRGTTAENVKENYGQGRVLQAKDALAVGMVDRIATFDSVLAKLQDGATAPVSESADQPVAAADHPSSASRGEIDPITLKPKEAPAWLLS